MFTSVMQLYLNTEVFGSITVYNNSDEVNQVHNMTQNYIC